MIVVAADRLSDLAHHLRETEAAHAMLAQLCGRCLDDLLLRQLELGLGRTRHCSPRSVCRRSRQDVRKTVRQERGATSENFGGRFSTKARTASLCSAVPAARTMFSASWS